MRLRLAATFAALTLPLFAVARPVVWMIPPNAGDNMSFRALFASPDGWAETRRHVDGVGYFANRMNERFTDAELRADFAMLRQWRLRFGLEMSGLKEFATTGDASFAHTEPILRRLQADGAAFSSLAFDEPLKFVTWRLRADADYAAAEVAKLVALLRRAHPGVEIGDIEPLPGITDTQLLQFVDAVDARTRAAGVRGLDFVRVDPNWGRFVYGERLGAAGWDMIHRVELGCRQRGVRFSLIHMASDFVHKREAGVATEQTWETSLLYEAGEYAQTGGVPDEVVVESWLHSVDNTLPEPQQAVPDSQPGTFTHSVIAVAARYGR